MKSEFKKLILFIFNLWCRLLHCITPNAIINNSYLINEHLQLNDSHVFRGYYDINYLSQDGDKFLIHILPLNNEKHGTIQIAFYRLSTKKISIIAESNAWSWQQGSRLRWIDNETVVYNDFSNDEYVSKFVDVNSKTCRKIIHYPLYEINSEKTLGLTVNFSRLERLRPGYGYRNSVDITEGICTPENDGVFIVDLRSETRKLLYSYKELHAFTKNELDGECYINHLCFSPDGDKFMFFFICMNSSKTKSKVYVFTSLVTEKKLFLIEQEDRASHYVWINDNEILLTLYKGKKQFYKRYTWDGNESSLFGESVLNEDGHPNSLDYRRIISDTYPMRKKCNRQLLFSYKEGDTTISSIGSFYTDPYYINEKRCDLHPSVSNGMISIDTNCNHIRSIYLISKKDK